MRQRIKMAQAIAHDPDVLLLDEPVSGMDPVNRRRVIDLVKKLGREGRTVVVSSHILHEVEAMTRRVLLIHNGRVLAEGDVREIRDLLDEHPHTVALQREGAAALARRVVDSPARALADLRRGRRVADRADRAPRRALRRAARSRPSQAGVSEMYSPDEDLESVFQLPGGAVRDTSGRCRSCPRRAPSSGSSLEGMLWSRRSLVMAVLLGLPCVIGLVYRAGAGGRTCPPRSTG